MKMNSYTIFDTCSGAYSRPFFTQSDGDAIRQFGDIANDVTHPIGKHPEHYKLFRNGIFDDEFGTYTPEETSHLANAHELMSNQQSGIQTDLDPETPIGLTD